MKVFFLIPIARYSSLFGMIGPRRNWSSTPLGQRPSGTRPSSSLSTLIAIVYYDARRSWLLVLTETRWVDGTYISRIDEVGGLLHEEL